MLSADPQGSRPVRAEGPLSVRYLRDAQHADAMLCRLVAHHSCAIIEAEERELADVLALEFHPRRTCCPAC